MQRVAQSIIKTVLPSLVVSLVPLTLCHIASAVEIVLQFDDFDRSETQANIQAGVDGFYDPEFNDFDITLPIRGTDINGTEGILLVAEIAGFGDNGTTSSRIRTFNEGAGVTNSNGSIINSGDTIQLTFNQPVTISSYSIGSTTTDTNMFYRVGDMLPVDITAPAMPSPQLVDIPDSPLPAGKPFTVGSNDSNFTLWGTVIEFAGLVSQPTVINVPPDAAPTSAAANTQVNLFAGGAIGSDFDAFDGSEVNISGGSVGDRFTSFLGSTVNVSGGTIGPSFSAVGTVNVSGGSFDCCFTAHGEVTVSGGSFSNAFHASRGSVVNITGGSLGRDFRALVESEVSISGGTMGDNFDTSPSSQLTLVGGRFRLDGVPIEGLNSIGDAIELDLPEGSVLSGVFTDGRVFAFSSVDADTIRDGSLTLKVGELPAIGPAIITLATDPLPTGLQTGQTLFVNGRGAVGDDYGADVGSSVHVARGRIGNNFEAIGAYVAISGGTVGINFDAFSGTKVDITGGSIGGGFEAHNGSEVNITGGLIGGSFRATEGSVVNISGGVVGSRFLAFGGSEVNISDGRIGEEFNAIDGSKVNISGGTFGINFQSFGGSEVNISGGSFGDGFRAPDGSMINLLGTQFVLDGVNITDSLTALEPLVIGDRDVSLVGLLADGSQFSFELNSRFTDGRDFFNSDAILSITLVPEPVSLLLWPLPIIAALCRRETNRWRPQPLST